MRRFTKWIKNLPRSLERLRKRGGGRGRRIGHA